LSIPTSLQGCSLWVLICPAVTRRTVAVRLPGARRIGGELGQQSLPVPFADAGGPGQAGAGRGLAGLDLGLIGRSDASPGAHRCAPV